MAELDPDLLQISIRKLGQHLYVDSVLGKGSCVLAETELLKPLRDAIWHTDGREMVE